MDKSSGNIIGKRIVMARVMGGLSRQDVVLRSRGAITKRELRAYEAGKKMPGSKVLIKIAEVCEVTLDFLVRPFSLGEELKI